NPTRKVVRDRTQIALAEVVRKLLDRLGRCARSGGRTGSGRPLQARIEQLVDALGDFLEPIGELGERPVRTGRPAGAIDPRSGRVGVAVRRLRGSWGPGLLPVPGILLRRRVSRGSRSARKW